MSDTVEIYAGKPSIDNMPHVLEAVERYFTERKVAEGDRAKLLVALDELYSNLCVHSGAQNVEIRCGLSECHAGILLVDNGIPFNPLEQKKPDVTLPAEERVPGGLGIYLVRKTMDKISYEYIEGKNFLTVVKKIALK
ncbi:MAG: ATP-binding protein [Butyrivibrio sp.]|nr:ATP-binding protein [Muribaculum sp.]MCM1552722.1 ATP-binding protein [Butyrivibrio sp.]